MFRLTVLQEYAASTTRAIDTCMYRLKMHTKELHGCECEEHSRWLNHRIRIDTAIIGRLKQRHQNLMNEIKKEHEKELHGYGT